MLRHMGWPFGSRMVERTCPECGETWTLTAGLMHDRHSGLGRRGFEFGTVSLQGTDIQHQIDEAHRRDAGADRDLAARGQPGSCPMCGSEWYFERHAWRWGRRAGTA